MSTYKEVRRITADKLQALCVEQGWYTRGTCEEYWLMLDTASSKENLTTDDIMAIAEDIMEHSNEMDMPIATVAFYVVNSTTTWFEAVEA